MDDRTFDAWSRRASLLTLGAASLAGIAASGSAGARKKGKGNSAKKCKKQVGACRAGLADLCEVVFGIDDVAACLDVFGPCCDFLKGCNTAQAVACAVEAAQNI